MSTWGDIHVESFQEWIDEGIEPVEEEHVPKHTMGPGHRHHYEPSQFDSQRELGPDKTPCAVCGNLQGATIHER